MKHLILLCLTWIVGITFGYAQQDWPFYEQIQEFKKQDSLSFPIKGGLLFIGSSSIARWEDLGERLSGYPIIQRGFGGSQFQDLLHYSEDILFPYRPSKIFIYAGENDLNSGKSVEEIFKAILEIYTEIRNRLPASHLYFISVKPSIKLSEYGPSIVQLNNKVKEFIKNNPCHATYVNIHQPMLNQVGEPRTELFQPDNLHLSGLGYDIWETEIRKFL